MKKISILLSAAFILLGAGMVSCKNPLDRTEAVSLSLPSWPPYECAEFPPLAYWEIRYAGGAQAGRFMRIEADAKSVTIEAASDRPLTVIALPVSRHGETDVLFFKPAGCVYPHENALSWESGFAAFVCMKLYSPANRTDRAQASHNGHISAKHRSNETANGTYLATFNWKKLCDALAEKSTDTEHPYDPWKADTEAVCTAIAEHSFGAPLLSMKKTSVITLSEIEQKAREIGTAQSCGTAMNRNRQTDSESQSGANTETDGEQSSPSIEIAMSQSAASSEIGAPQSSANVKRHTETSHALFIPQYIPLYRTQRKTGKTLVKKTEVTSWLYTIQSIAAIQYRTGGFPALVISAVPLYTGEQ